MIKLNGLIKRKKGLSHHEFLAFWQEHAKLVYTVKEELNIVRYIQSPTIQNEKMQKAIQETRKSLDFDFDAYAEVHYESIESMNKNRETLASQKARNLLLEDETQFVDLSQSVFWFSEVKKII